jgi:serine phosphatase RsbU (regulator of sigma subunit)
VTDGVTEAENEKEEFYGPTRMAESFHKSGTFDEVVTDLSCFCGSAAANDDCTMVEICYR